MIKLYFSGVHCDIDNACMSTSNPCRNNASCEPSLDGSANCICTAGWTGRNCTIDINECLEGNHFLSLTFFVLLWLRDKSVRERERVHFSRFVVESLNML